MCRAPCLAMSLNITGLNSKASSHRKSLGALLVPPEGPSAPSPDGLKARAGDRTGYQRLSPSTDLPRCSRVDTPAGPLPEGRQHPTIRRSRQRQHDRRRPASPHADEVQPVSPTGYQPRSRGGAGTGQRWHRPRAGQWHQEPQPTLAASVPLGN